MTGALFVLGLTIGVTAGAAGYVFRHHLRRWWAVRKAAGAGIRSIRAGWQIALYDAGTGEYAHLTPTVGGHTEDDHGDCYCNPLARDYRTDNGRVHSLFIHRHTNGIDGSAR